MAEWFSHLILGDYLMKRVPVEEEIKLRDWLHSLGPVFKTINPKVEFSTGCMTNIDCFVARGTTSIRFSILDTAPHTIIAEVWHNGQKKSVQNLCKRFNVHSHNTNIYAEMLKEFTEYEFNKLYSL